MALRAVVFDLDDTLADTAGAWRETWSRSVEIIRSHVPAVDADELTRRYLAVEDSVFEGAARGEIGLETYRRTCLASALVPWGAPSAALVDDYLAERARMGERIVLFPDALQILRLLRRDGIRLALLTNGPTELQRPKVELLRLEPEVDAVAISGEIGAKKPEPEAYAHVLRQLGTRADETAMVGDSLENDVLGPLRAGLGAAVWLSPNGDAPPDGAQAARSLSEVPRLLGLRRLS